MTQFLKQIAGVFLAKEGAGISDNLFVFPNRRAALFFRKYLCDACEKPIFSPELTTINDFFEKLSGLRKVDNLLLLHRLFVIYSEVFPDSGEKFDDFIRWGDVLLSDFDDIDKFLADPKALFQNLADLKKLDDESFSYLSDDQKNAIRSFWGNLNLSLGRGGKNSGAFVTLWNSMFRLYSSFRESLVAEGNGYDGMIYRNVAEKLGDGGGLPEAIKKYKKVVFVGLNALSRCEEVVMLRLKREGAADFYWDYPGKLIRDEMNVASSFMNDNLRNFPSRYELEGEEEAPQDIQVLGFSSRTAQAKHLPGLFDEMGVKDGDAAFSTAVVLPDASLLPAVLDSIPPAIRDINVTMGYPLGQSVAATFVRFLTALHFQCKEQNGQVAFYHRAVEDILDHPYVSGQYGDEVKEMKAMMLRGQMVYVPQNVVAGSGVLSSIFGGPFTECTSAAALGRWLADILETVREWVTELDREYIYHFISCINRIDSLNIEMEKRTWCDLLDRISSPMSVPFSGEPLSGLQIMGPLETRALDFENVIIFSMNEGTFPAKSVTESMIPFNLKMGFGLPTYKFKDAVSAYHFYRNIARASKVRLLYAANAKDGGSACEASRYISQLKYHHQIPLTEKFITSEMGTESSVQPLAPIAKTEAMVQKLKALTYSHSSIDTYLKCGLKFYYQQVEGLGEKDEIEDELDSGMFGSIFHTVMELLYEPYCGKRVTDGEIKEMQKRMDDAVARAFREEMKISEITGRNVIYAALITRYAKKVLENDAARVPFTYIDSEFKAENVSLATPGGNAVKLKGYIDRIDRYDRFGDDTDVLRICDYKTGGVHIGEAGEEDFNVGDVFDVTLEDRPYTAAQLLFYLLLLTEKPGTRRDFRIEDVSRILLDVCSTRKLFKKGRDKEIKPFSISGEQFAEYRERLAALLDEIMNIGIPFNPPADGTLCEKCPFRIICNR